MVHFSPVRLSAARRAAASALLALACPALAFPATVADPPAAVHGTTTTQRGSVVLPGVEVAATDVSNGVLAGIAVSDGRGRYRIAQLPPGRYTLRARLPGFADAARGPVDLVSVVDVQLDLDLAIAPVAEEVRVVGKAEVAAARTASSQESVKGRMADLLPVAGDGFRSLLPILPGVVRQQDGRISLKGARPTQGALQLGPGSGNDPSTGNFGVELPVDAVESVTVLPNPYGAEDGRFSSSVVRVETRTGDNEWHAAANGFIPIPCLKVCDGASVGLIHFAPRLWLGGPLVRNRLFLSQSVEYRMDRTRFPDLPHPDSVSRTDSFDVFTRVDAVLAPRHTAAATVAFFPRELRDVNLNTFNPPEAAADFRLRGHNVSLVETATLSPSIVLASYLGSTLFHTTIDGEGRRDLELGIDGWAGNYFNTQERRTRALQWNETLTAVRRTRRGEHLLKIGIDLLRASYEGTSVSRPVIVRRADGTASQRYEFGGPTTQRSAGTDLAVFASDRWRLGERFLVEPGLRVDRDGVLGRTHVSPRLGGAIGILPREEGVLRGGAGMFHERTPLNVGAFESFEPVTVTRFGPDGSTPVAGAVLFVPRSAGLDTPRALVWNLEYNHRLSDAVLLKVNHLRRRGSHEHVVEPDETGPTPILRLDDSGRSRYRETEVTVRAGASDQRQVTVSYVRSSSRGDLNAFDQYYGNFRTPIVRRNESSLAPVDVPNRLVVRIVTPVVWRYSLSALLEVRDGFPYSRVNEDQEFVGARNTGGRLPRLGTVDVTLQRDGTLLGKKVRFGLRINHVLHNFVPRDVQNNVDSPAYGRLSNPIPRRIAFTFQFFPK